MTEEWKDIEGFGGLYQVSNLGRVKSVCRIVFRKTKRGSFVKQVVEERILNPIKSSNGYLKVGLYRYSRCYQRSVHRLVAEAFIDNPLHLKAIDHIDTDKTNNAASNLKWSTSKDNVNNPISRLKRKYKYRGRLAIDVARDNGIGTSTFTTRMWRGWSVEDACTKPVKGVRNACC